MRTRLLLVFAVCFCVGVVLAQEKAAPNPFDRDFVVSGSGKLLTWAVGDPVAISFGYEREEILKVYNAVCWQDVCVPMADVLDFIEAKGTP